MVLYILVLSHNDGATEVEAKLLVASSPSHTRNRDPDIDTIPRWRLRLPRVLIPSRYHLWAIRSSVLRLGSHKAGAQDAVSAWHGTAQCWHRSHG